MDQNLSGKVGQQSAICWKLSWPILITLLRKPIFCHFGSTSFVLPIRPKYGILNRVIRVCAERVLTPNRPLIQLWCARSKLNMDEICSLNIHL